MGIGKGFKRDDQAVIPCAAQSLGKLTGVRAHIQHDVDPMPLQSGLKPTKASRQGRYLRISKPRFLTSFRSPSLIPSMRCASVNSRARPSGGAAVDVFTKWLATPSAIRWLQSSLRTTHVETSTIQSPDGSSEPGPGLDRRALAVEASYEHHIQGDLVVRRSAHIGVAPHSRLSGSGLPLASATRSNGFGCIQPCVLRTTLKALNQSWKITSD